MTALTPTLTYGSLNLTATPYLWEFGGDFGAPENASQVILSLLQDGDLEVSDRAGNRTISLTILVEGANLDALADAEAALELECRKERNELTINPGDGVGSSTVFSTFRAQLSLVRDDDWEQSTLRRYSLVMRALPHGRSTTQDTLTPTPTSIGTARQQMHTVTTAGSARTEAAFTLASTVSLGEVLAYWFPDDGRGYSPPLRQFATAGTTAAATTDSTLVSGKRNMIDTAAVFEVPGETLYDGLHLVLVRARGSADGTVNVRCKLEWLVGTTVVATEYVGNSTIDIGSIITVSPQVIDNDDINVWQYRILGTASLPLRDVGDQANATLRVTIDDPETTGVDLDIDEGYLLNLTVGGLVQADCGTGAAASGGPSRRLYIEPPTVSNPLPRLLRGHATDMSDAFNPGELISSWDTPVLEADTNTKILTVTPNTTASALTVRRWKRWHTHAGS